MAAVFLLISLHGWFESGFHRPTDLNLVSPFGYFESGLPILAILNLLPSYRTEFRLQLDSHLLRPAGMSCFHQFQASQINLAVLTQRSLTSHIGSPSSIWMHTQQKKQALKWKGNNLTK